MHPFRNTKSALADPHNIMPLCIATYLSDNYIRQLSKRLLENLQKIEEQPQQLSRRILWELLQNACDALPNDGALDFTVNYQWPLLTITHRGRDFQLNELASLCSPDSSKDEDPDTIGQYGTGFLSTHSLSAVITVEGACRAKDSDGIEERYAFKLDLDRSGSSLKRSELAEGMRQSLALLDQSYRSISINTVKPTTFTYNLSNQMGILPQSMKGKDAIQKLVTSNLAEFVRLLPYAALFCGKKIDRVSIVNGGQENVFTFEDDTRRKIFRMRRNSTDCIAVLRYASAENHSLIVAVPQEGNDSNSIGSMDTLPRLFCCFPLLGSETIFCPAIVHYRYFAPTEKRDDISETRNLNTWRNLILPIVKSFLLSLGPMESKYHLLPKVTHTGHWTFAYTFQHIIMVTAIVPTGNGETVPLSKIKMPQSTELHELLQSLYVVPRSDELSEWRDRCSAFICSRNYNLRANHSFIRNYNRRANHEFIEELTDDDLVLCVEKSSLHLGTKWYEKSLRFLFRYGPHHLREKPLLLNRRGVLVALSSRPMALKVSDSEAADFISLHKTVTQTDLQTKLLCPSLHELVSLMGSDIINVTIPSLCVLLNQHITDNWSKLSQRLDSDNQLQNAFSTLFRLMEAEDEVRKSLRFVKKHQAVIMLKIFPVEKQQEVMHVMQAPKCMEFLKIAREANQLDKLTEVLSCPNVMKKIQNASKEELAALFQNLSIVGKNVPTMLAPSQSALFGGVSWSSNIRSLPQLQPAFASCVTAEVGEQGERLVYNDLCRKYDESNVVWSAHYGEGRFDIQVCVEGKVMYVEVKSTSASRSELTAIHMHASQWKKMKEVGTKSNSKEEYWMARCFNVLRKGEGEIDYVRMDYSADIGRV